MCDPGPSGEQPPGRPAMRKKKISNEELEVLVAEVLQRFHSEERQIMGPERHRHWEQFTLAINEISPYGRKVHEVQKRWADYKARLKSKLARQHRHAHGTGGGPPMDISLTPLEERARAAISLVKIVGVGDIDTGYSPPRRGDSAPLGSQQQATEADSEVARDVDRDQVDPGDNSWERALSDASQRLYCATDSQNDHLALIASTVQHTDQQITSPISTLSTFMSTHTSLMSSHNSLMATHNTQMANLTQSMSHIETLLGELLHAHSQRTSATFPSPSSDFVFTSPHTQLAGGSNLPVGYVASPLPVGYVASPLPVGSVASPLPVGSVASPLPVGSVASPLPVGSVASPLPVGSVPSPLLDPALCRLMCFAFARGFGQSPVVVPSQSSVVVPSQSPVHEAAPSPRQTQTVSHAGLAASSEPSTSRMTRSRSWSQPIQTPYKKPTRK
ncbi:uncharacterized protein LOC142140324 [Mixophyes fleayi]|uniref:uncharacterized protein LOC142140324 n=1 Tax=Mixophyes fleayi TaxID=3061075 RepID=UPI003F4D8EDD